MCLTRSITNTQSKHHKTWLAQSRTGNKKSFFYIQDVNCSEINDWLMINEVTVVNNRQMHVLFKNFTSYSSPSRYSKVIQLSAVENVQSLGYYFVSGCHS